MLETAVPSYFLRTKLHRPLLPSDYIPRPRLLEQLERIVQRQVAILVAPAGYGKSTLASAWVEQSHCPGAWLSLDEGDNELFVFIGYFVAAIESVFPNFGERISVLARNPTRPSLPTVSNYLLYEIDQIEQDFVLVLDDFQAITNSDVHEILQGLFRYPLPHFHLVLISRHKPPLQVLKLQAQSRLGELRTNDLRFSETEVAAFAEKALPFPPDAATIKSLAEKTEGWPVGLRLATIAIRRWGLDEHQPAVLQVDNQYIVEYLINEVLVRQAASIRMLLLKTSILDRFTAPLCAAILNSEAVEQKILLQLEREGMFIESLDNRREWFRYHQLFRELLYEQLTEQFAAAEIAAMHLRASKWLAAQGYLEEAIDHALLGGDESAAVSILFAHGPLLVSEERWLLLERLLNKFRPEIINREPLLLLLLCWLSLARYYLARLESIRECIAAAEIGALEPEQKRFLDCSMHTFAAIGQNWAGNFERTVLHSRKALALIRPEWPVVAGYAWIHLGTAVHHLKGGEAALVALAEDEHLAVSSRDRIYKYIAVSFVDWLTGDLTKLFYTARNGLELMGSKDLLLSSGILHLMAGSACYERNELDTAAEHFTAVLGVKYGYRALPFMYCAIGQALVYLAQNMANEAWEVIETAVEFCLETEHSSLLLVGRAFQAELALRQGQTDKARQLVANLEGTFLSKLMPHPYQPQITLPKVWLFEETPASRQKAEAELRRLRSIVTETHNVPGRIRVLCLQALLCQSQNKMEAAEEALVQAVRLAQPGGFIRSFVDLGPLMAVLLKHLYLQGYAPVFIQQILEAFPSSRPAPNTTPPLLLIESLTDREMEVLNLLAQRLSNKEISKMLVISPETVKRHTSNIYQKLQVKNRRQAVAKAYSLNLLVDVA